MANDEFVDLDEIVPGTGFSKKSDEASKKKEKEVPVQQQEQTKQAQETEENPKPSQTPKKEEKEQEENGAEKTSNTQQREKKKENGSNGMKPEQKSPSIKEVRIKEIKAEKEATEKKSKPLPAKEIAVKQNKPVDKSISAKKSSIAVKSSNSSASKQEIKKQAPARQEKKKAKQIKSKKAKSEKGNGKETNWALIAILILAVIIIGVIIYMAVNFDFGKTNNESVVAVVNGQPIYKSELMNRYNLLKSTMNPFITEEQVLNLTITDRLLLQEATKKGITTSDEEVKELIDGLMIQNNINEESLKKDLADKNVSYEFLVGLYKNTLTINKLVEQSFGNVTLTEEELNEFYNLSKEELKVPDMVQARHILFLFGNVSENETYNKAQDVLKQIKADNSNFCSLVSKYTEDIGSKETCGEYNYSKDYPFVKEFIDAGFSMKKGDIKIVKTQLGYHIMYKVADLPGYIPSFKDVKDDLEPVLIQEKSLQGLSDLINELHSNAIIEVYTENISTKRFNEITIDKEAPAVSEPDNKTVQEENKSQETKPETQAEAEPEQTTEAPKVEVTKEVINTPKSQRMMLAECLTDKKARMFTASWSPDSATQLELFEEDKAGLVIVECDPEANNADLAECGKVLKKKYPTWPTWQINGELYEGVQSLSALAKLSGCAY